VCSHRLLVRTDVLELQAGGVAGVWHHSRAYWFLGRARWDLDRVGMVLARLVVAGLVPAGAAVLVAVDDTLFRRCGRRVAGAAWQHDGSRCGPKAAQVSWGTCFVVVVAGIVVDLPFCDRPVCLPVLARLWTPGGPVSKQVLLSRLVATITAALHAIAPPEAGRGSRGGRPRRIGARLGTPTDLAGTTTQQQAWRPAVVARYGGRDRVDVTETVCLWYGTYRSRAVRVILVREPGSTAKSGYDVALISTDLDSPTDTIVARYAARWAIEVAIEDAEQTTGVGQTHTRTRPAVERAVPFGLTAQTIVIIWYAGHGHHPDLAAERRATAPWYRTKTHPPSPAGLGRSCRQTPTGTRKVERSPGR
jgi:hypothetical protein